MIGWVLRSVREYKCEHDWELVARGTTYENNSDKELGKLPLENYIIYRCKKCGAKRKY